MDDSEARAILREHGEEPPAKGKLGPQWRVRAEELRQGPDPFGPVPADTYDGGVTADDFTDVTEASAPPLPAERKPRKVRRAGPSTAGWFRKAGQGKAKKRHPRVPVDSLISSAWAAMGGLAMNVDPPLGRCLVMQARVAGLILEDLVRGTAVDRALQPVARAEEKAEKALALFAPPAIVAALEAAQNLPEPQRRAREAILIPLLRRSMVLWVKIAGDKIDQQLQRAAEEGPAQAKADELLAMIWAQPEAPPPAPEADRETVSV